MLIKILPLGGEGCAELLVACFWLLVGSAKCRAKMFCGRSRPRGAGFLLRSEVTVRVSNVRVNTQELCNGKIFFSRFLPGNADEEEVELIGPEVLSKGGSRERVGRLEVSATLDSRNLHSGCTG
jgi:hypothetical protein